MPHVGYYSATEIRVHAYTGSAASASDPYHFHRRCRHTGDDQRAFDASQQKGRFGPQADVRWHAANDGYPNTADIG
jgi:hypothetical protein